jgi:hypothetical protein
MSARLASCQLRGSWPDAGEFAINLPPALHQIKIHLQDEEALDLSVQLNHMTIH